jgi:hypothetical protein
VRSLEEVADLEVQFPPRRRVAQGVDPVEAVAEVEAERAEGGDQGDAEPGAAVQPRD